MGGSDDGRCSPLVAAMRSGFDCGWGDGRRETTPALLGLFSLVTLLAHKLSDGQPRVQTTAWYAKTKPTFSDAIALVRYHLWTTLKFANSPVESRFHLIPDSLLSGLVETICYAT